MKIMLVCSAIIMVFCFAKLIKEVITLKSAKFELTKVKEKTKKRRK